MFLSLSAAICLLIWKSHQGVHSALPGTLYGTAPDSPASRTKRLHHHVSVGCLEAPGVDDSTPFLLSQLTFTNFLYWMFGMPNLMIFFYHLLLAIYSFTFCLVYAYKITQSNIKACFCYPRPDPSVSSIALQQNTGCILPSCVPRPADPTDHPLLSSRCILVPNSNRNLLLNHRPCLAENQPPVLALAGIPCQRTS